MALSSFGALYHPAVRKCHRLYMFASIFDGDYLIVERMSCLSCDMIIETRHTLSIPSHKRDHMAEIWVVLEHSNGTLHEQSGELLSETVEIAKHQPTETPVCAVLLTSQQPELPDITLLPKLGIQRLYLLEHPQFTHYTTLS